MYGLFVRKYFGNYKVSPFVEFGIGGGRSKMKTEEVSLGGGQCQLVESRNLFYLSGSPGISYGVNQKIRINLIAKIQHTREKPVNSEAATFTETRILNFDSALILSFSYFLNRKPKQ